jgi:hypothetical protein
MVAWDIQPYARNLDQPASRELIAEAILPATSGWTRERDESGSARLAPLLVPARIPADLAVARLVFFGGLTLFYAPHRFAIWSEVTPALWQPIWLFDRFDIPVFSTPIVLTLEIIWKLSLLTSAIGLMTTASIATSAVLGTYLLGLPHNFGQTYHFDAVLVLAFWILASRVRATPGRSTR